MAITDKEIQDYWHNYDWFIIRWFCVSAFFVSTLLPWVLILDWVFEIQIHWYFWFLYLIIPINILLKYVFNVKGLWFLNDTKDGDFGDPEELKKAGRNPGKTFGNFIWWWFRNHSWNFNRKFIPEWDAGQAEDFRVIRTSLTNEQILNNRWTWCSKKGIHGHHYIAARINGKVEVRFSEANSKMQRQMGSGGNEYRFRFKGLFTIFTNQIKRLIKKIKTGFLVFLFQEGEA